MLLSDIKTQGTQLIKTNVINTSNNAIITLNQLNNLV